MKKVVCLIGLVGICISLPAVVRAEQVTVPTGTQITVCLEEGIETKNKPGQIFAAVLESNLVQDGILVAPHGTKAYVKLLKAKRGSRLIGKSNMTVKLHGIRINGNIVHVNSDNFEIVGKGRGANTATKAGVGAGVGSVAGSLLGGKKGRLVGAGIGAVVGGATNLLSRGETVELPMETLLEFTLSESFTADVSVI